MPFELRPEPNPTLRPDGEYLQRAWRESVYPLAAQLGVEIRLPDVSPQPHTRLAFEGLQYAKEHGAANRYNGLVFRAFFQQSRDIGDLAVLADIAAEAGLGAEDFGLALRTGRHREAHHRALYHAYQEMGITAVPAFIIGSGFLRGLQPRETLEAAIDEAAAEGPA